MSTNPKAIVLLSGGMDSTVLATDLVKGFGRRRVHGLGVHYGQRHVKELEAAKEVAAFLGIRYDVVDLSVLGASIDSALTTSAIDVPDGHYADESMKSTVVPNRNAIMLMVAVGIAASRGADVVCTAVHAGDHPVYPDCRPDFIHAASAAALLGTAGIGDVKITAPFVNWTKTEIAAHGAHLQAPLRMTWSCYKGGSAHCGTCGTCVERREAFANAGLNDPTEYLAVA